MREDVMKVIQVMEVMNAEREADAVIALPRTIWSALRRF